MRRINLSLLPTNKCAEHGVIGMFPCAFPGCTNGVCEDEFEEVPLIAGSKARRWKRREWHSPLGSAYYSWESSTLPNWFQTTRILWDEARRLQLVPNFFPATVYHYTSLEGFVGIVSNRSVWMTEFAYLNDRREVRYGLDLVLEAVNALLDTEADESVRNLLSTWKEQLGSERKRIYITSFSGEDDSLSQWRAYGPIAIGFPVQSLSLHVNQGSLQAVEYDPNTQKKLVEIYAHHLVSAFQADLRGNRLERIPDVYHKLDKFVELATLFKDPAFRSENEYRLTFIDMPELFEELGVKSPRRSFRAARGRLIPFIPSTQILPSEHRDFPLEISEVVLGPESDDLLEQGVREFLDDNGLKQVQVRRSLVPLRS